MDEEEFLFSLSRFGIKLGLGPTQTFAEKVGNPQNKFRSVHVAGSNGKGSVTTFIYRILRKRYRSGIYTSPHLRRFSERIIVDDTEIPSIFIKNFVRTHNPSIEIGSSFVDLTFFEYTTVMAFKFFQEMGTEFAAIEVGLGGRLDSTNILKPEASVITSISLEHSDKLGGNLENIAIEKGGIIKENKPVVIGIMPELAKSVIKSIAKEKGSPVEEVDECSIRNVHFSLENTEFNLSTAREDYHIRLKALGEHQVNNAVASVLATESSGASIRKEEITSALDSGIIPGRFEIRRREPLMIIDGAHNSEASRILSSNIRRYGVKDPLIVLGILKDKNSYNIMQNLSEVAGSVLITEPNEPERKKNAEDLMREARLFFREVTVKKHPKEAIEYALAAKRNTVATGSIYLIGEIENILDEKERENSLQVESAGYRKDSSLEQQL